MEATPGQYILGTSQDDIPVLSSAYLDVDRILKGGQDHDGSTIAEVRSRDASQWKRADGTLFMRLRIGS